MRTYLSAISLAALAAALALSGCEEGYPTGNASAGASAPVNFPVGPMPGPGSVGPGPSDPYPQSDSVALAEGRTLFVQMNCAGCHGGHGGGGMGPSLRDKSWIYGGTDADLFSSIDEGRAHGMPAWGTRLPQSEIWKLVAYIQSMRTSHEPHPPS